MKLIYCRACHDMVALVPDALRSCRCGQSSGYYGDNVNALFFGDHAMPVGFTNSSFRYALENQPFDGDGQLFKAFVIPHKCSTFRRSETALPLPQHEGIGLSPMSLNPILPRNPHRVDNGPNQQRHA